MASASSPQHRPSIIRSTRIHSRQMAQPMHKRYCPPNERGFGLIFAKGTERRCGCPTHLNRGEVMLAGTALLCGSGLVRVSRTPSRLMYPPLKHQSCLSPHPYRFPAFCIPVRASSLLPRKTRPPQLHRTTRDGTGRGEMPWTLRPQHPLVPVEAVAAQG